MLSFIKFIFGGVKLKVAVVGSRGLDFEIKRKYLPAGTTCVISGGAAGVDKSAARLAEEYGLELKEDLPDYKRYGSRAPLIRNAEIIGKADIIVAFWDGESRGTAYVINLCRKKEKPLIVYTVKNGHITDVKDENMPLRW